MCFQPCQQNKGRRINGIYVREHVWITGASRAARQSAAAVGAAGIAVGTAAASSPEAECPEESVRCNGEGGELENE